MIIEKRKINNNAASEDKELVVRLIRNDQEAFCELYARYKERLLYFAIKFVKSYDYAEDVYQDAFSMIWQSRGFLDPEKNFSSYLYSIVKNRILNILRDIENDRKLKSYILTHAIDYSETTNECLQMDELKVVLEKAIRKLTPRQRQIFELSRNERMTHKEIAEVLDISVYTVNEHISVALKTIRLYLSKYPDYLAGLFLILICVDI